MVGTWYLMLLKSVQRLPVSLNEVAPAEAGEPPGPVAAVPAGLPPATGVLPWLAPGVPAAPPPQPPIARHAPATSTAAERASRNPGTPHLLTFDIKDCRPY